MDFITEKFIAPLCHYYTLEATIAYGLLLVLAVLGTQKLLEKMKVKIDKNFFVAILPFIIYGGWTRALKDYELGMYKEWWWCSPPIYLVIFLMTVLLLAVSIGIEKKTKIEYWKNMLVFGSLMLLYNLMLTNIENWFGFAVVAGLAIFWFLILVAFRKIKPKLLSNINGIILWSHLLDGSATFTALTFFGYYEQHVLPTFLINIFGPWVMFPLKLIVVYSVLYLIDKYEKDEQSKNFLKLIILILGLALGIRDWLTISMNPLV